MSKSVRVGGVEVTQSKLGDMCAYLSAHGCAHVPEGYAPDIGRFRQYEGATIGTPEEYVYLLCENPELDRGFRAAFIDPPRKAALSSPIGILVGAGFPTVITLQASQRLHDLARVDAWADGFKGPLTPWLWVMGGKGHVGVADVVGFGLLQGSARHLDADFHRRIEHPVDGCLDVENHAYFRWPKKADTVDTYGSHAAFAVPAGGNAGRLVQKPHQVAPEGDSVGIGVARVDDVMGDGGGFFDSLGCFFHVEKYRFL